MEDREIVALYWARAESAIRETIQKYSTYCRHIAGRILSSREDTEECLNDTWLGAWNAMPPHRPERLPPLLGRICRNAALDRCDYNNAAKRCPGFEAVLDELAECVADGRTQEVLDLRQLGSCISGWLDTLPAVQRRVFLCRYWYCDSLADIAARFHFTQSKVKSLLFRLRKGLREHLLQEGYTL